MTKLRDIFEKPVDRAIEGVIKADDEASLRVELEEYVITNEIERQLEKFLDAYNNYETANGVWISGFFGSGKSHLLKMLALLLENRDAGGTPAYELFKQKCADNEILAADLRKAVSIPSRSILFNIDQKADVISKEQIDALLSVFQKVFDEMCGYYGKQPHIAQFERDLDSRGVLEKFQKAYQAIAGKPWERGREQALLESANIAKAYAEATGADPSAAQGILTQYRQDFRSSIEDFADKVKAYIDAQEPGFRLNFFVDEVGQYIADNVKLMTNLQTIAESLNTKCRGRAWIIVTAQQDMGSVIGDMTQRQENDFSKIQARFANRMPLNSADVAEVIQKRLLKKTEAGVLSLTDLYHREANNLKTLFDFSDGSMRLENFRDRAPLHRKRALRPSRAGAQPDQGNHGRRQPARRLRDLRNGGLHRLQPRQGVLLPPSDRGRFLPSPDPRRPERRRYSDHEIQGRPRKRGAPPPQGPDRTLAARRSPFPGRSGGEGLARSARSHLAQAARYPSEAG